MFRMSQFVKAGSIYKTAKEEYNKQKAAGKMKLAGVINYAITSHVVDLDERLGKKLYGEAVHLKLLSSILTNLLSWLLIHSLI